jgi:serine/threonine protein kinase
MPFVAGENVGPYRILEQLGQGGMATVYKAYHPALDRKVAIKVLHAALRGDPHFLQRFIREARVVAQLEHPNIVPIYDFEEKEGQPYLVMKFIEGETLKARLARGPLSIDETIAITREIGKALSYAHQRGVLHRDVKPSNILLSNDGRIYLGDFGLARIVAAGESTLSSDMMMGTPQYISPEQARGERDLDAGTDIYSFGVVLYEMVVGRVPFQADTPFSIIHDHIYTPLPLPSRINPDVPEVIEKTLLKALAKERQDRFSDVELMVEAFTAGLEGAESALETASGTIPIETEIHTRSMHEESKERIQPPRASSGFNRVSPKGEEGGAVAEKQPKRSFRWVWIAVGLIMACLSGLMILSVVDKIGRNGEHSGEINQPQIMEPKDANAYFEMGQNLLDEGNVQDAVVAFSRAATLYMEEGKYREAAKVYCSLIQASDGQLRNMPQMVEGLMQALFLGAGEDILPVVDEAREINPDSPMWPAIDARIMLIIRGPEGAKDMLTNHLMQNTDDIYARAVRAELQYTLGNNERAMSDAEWVLSQEKIPDWLRKHIEKLVEDIRISS